MQKLTVCVLVVAFGLLTSCTESVVSTEMSSESRLLNPAEKPLADYGNNLVAIAQKYRSSPEFHSCMSNAVRLCETQAGQTEAIAKDDLKICDELSDVSVRLSCRSAVIDARFITQKDISVCDAVSGVERQNCRIQHLPEIAVTKQSPQTCESLKKDFSEEEKARGEYEFSMCVIESLTRLKGKDAKVWCNKIQHSDNKENCLRIWKIDGHTGSTSPNAGTVVPSEPSKAP